MSSYIALEGLFNENGGVVCAWDVGMDDGVDFKEAIDDSDVGFGSVGGVLKEITVAEVSDVEISSEVWSTGKI